jgi:hypothetical protein
MADEKQPMDAIAEANQRANDELRTSLSGELSFFQRHKTESSAPPVQPAEPAKR